MLHRKILRDHPFYKLVRYVDLNFKESGILFWYHTREDKCSPAETLSHLTLKGITPFNNIERKNLKNY